MLTRSAVFRVFPLYGFSVLTRSAVFVVCPL